MKVFRQGPEGIVAALEKARSEARGEFLARMDADDRCEPRRFERQRALLEERRDVVACGTWIRYFPRGSVRDGALRYERWLNASSSPEDVARNLFVECPLAHPSFFLSAAAVDRVGGYRDMGWAEDYDLLLRLWAAGGGLANVPEVLLHWREGADRLHRRHPAYGENAFARCKVEHLRRTLLADGRAVVVWGAGPVGKAFARTLVDSGGLLRGFVDVDPRKVGQEIHGVRVLDARTGLAESGVLHVAAVGQPGARSDLRDTLTEAGLEELVDFVAVA